MTLIDNTVSRATSTPTAPAAPTSTTETIASPGPGVFLRVVAVASSRTRRPDWQRSPSRS
jgi:hypothetical protein